jgi:recombinational DNA repair ATPase RecF
MKDLTRKAKANEPLHELPTARLTRSQSLKANTVKMTNLKDHPQKDQEILGNQDAETETQTINHITTQDGPHKNDLLFAASTTPAR